jgi:hypothetical protein
MNTCAQPSEGAGGSRSQAAGELTLGLMSGEERGGDTDRPLLFCGSEPAREGGLTGAGTSQMNEPSKQAGR